MKTLIIDLSRGSEVKILNAKVTHSVAITAGYFLGLTETDDPIEVVADKLKQENLLNLPAFIIPPEDMVEKHLFHFPKMPDKELRKVLPREIAGVRDTDDSVVFNYLENGTVEERQVQKIEIAAFFCGRDAMFEYINRFAEKGIQVKRVVPQAQGLKTIVELNPNLHKKKTGSVFIDLMSNRIDMNFFKEKYWGLERDFLFRVDSDDDLHDEDFTRISTELNRTFQFFKQRNRGHNLEQVVIYGSSGNIDHLKNLINDNLTVNAASITPEFFHGKASFPSHLKDSPEFISTFTLAIATGISATRKKYLDLFPEEYKEKAKLPSRLIGLTISTIIIGAIMFGSTVYFEGIKSNYTDDIAKIEETYNSLSKNAVTIDLTKKQRAAFYKHQYYRNHPTAYSFSAADFTRRLSLISSPEIELEEMVITPGSQSFKFVLSGSIKADDNIKAQNKFLQFFAALKRFDDIVQVDSSNVNVNPGEKPGTSRKTSRSPDSTTPPPPEKEVELYFTISGEVELDI